MEGDPALTVQTQVTARHTNRLALIIAAIAALALSFVLGMQPAFAGGGATLNPGVIGTDSSNAEDLADFPCPEGDEEGVPAGQVMWHFVLNGVDPGIESSITGHFDFTPDSADQDKGSEKWNPGGSNHQFFVFTNGDAVLDGATADIGESEYSQFTLSHICVGEETSTPTPTPTPEGSQAGGTGTPAASVPDTSATVPGLGGPLATLIFGGILLSSLGALAYANVRSARSRQ
jgi:hypothetical protein